MHECHGVAPTVLVTRVPRPVQVQCLQGRKKLGERVCFLRMVSSAEGTISPDVSYFVCAPGVKGGGAALHGFEESCLPRCVACFNSLEITPDGRGSHRGSSRCLSRPSFLVSMVDFSEIQAPPRLPATPIAPKVHFYRYFAFQLANVSSDPSPQPSLVHRACLANHPTRRNPAPSIRHAQKPSPTLLV